MKINALIIWALCTIAVMDCIRTNIDVRTYEIVKKMDLMSNDKN